MTAARPAGGDARAADWLAGGWLAAARRVASPNFGPRPDGAAVTLALIHSISLPPGVYGGDEVERDILLRALERHRYNRTAAGASLGLSLRQMRYRMARLGIVVASNDGFGTEGP